MCRKDVYNCENIKINSERRKRTKWNRWRNYRDNIEGWVKHESSSTQFTMVSNIIWYNKNNINLENNLIITPNISIPSNSIRTFSNFNAVHIGCKMEDISNINFKLKNTTRNATKVFIKEIWFQTHNNNKKNTAK